MKRKRIKNLRNRVGGEEIPISAAQENPDIMGDDQISWESRSEENEENYQLAKKVESLLQYLTPLYQTVIRRLAKGDHYQVIADDLGMSVGNISTIQKQAEKKIRKLMGKMAT